MPAEILEGEHDKRTAGTEKISQEILDMCCVLNVLKAILFCGQRLFSGYKQQAHFLLHIQRYQYLPSGLTLFKNKR